MTLNNIFVEEILFYNNSFEGLLCSTSFLTKLVEEVKPVKVYNNFSDDRTSLIKENNGKVGVYCLVNLTNGHCYVGSSSNLAVRMRNYLNNSFLSQSQNANMPIIKALSKYGQHNFAVLIIEYTDTDTVNVRETVWITELLPYYNVLKQGYSSLGYKHTEATKELLSELAKNRTHSDETKSLIAESLTGENNPFYGKSHSEESKLKISKANSAFPLYVYNSLRQLVMICPSVRALADLINTNSSTITNSIKNESLFRGEWYFSSMPYNIEDTPLISDYDSKEGQEVILDMENSSHIRKAIFLFNSQKEFIRRYDGILIASKDLGISHSIIQKNIELKTPYKGYFFSYERL